MSKTNLIAEPGKQEITITRTFDAPPELVFKAYTDPKLLSRWLGPRKFSTPVCDMDARSGGSWRFVHADDEGNQYGFHGVYHAVVAPREITWTFEFEGMPGHVSLETVTFTGQDGKTLVTTHSVYQSLADRDGMLSSGMETGLNEGYDRLDELLRERQKEGVPAQ